MMNFVSDKPVGMEGKASALLLPRPTIKGSHLAGLRAAE